MDDDPRIAVLSHNEIARVGLGRILEESGFEITIMVGSVDELLGSDDRRDVHVVLLEIARCQDGLRDCERIRDALPDARIVVMVDEFTSDDVSAAFHSSAVDGYIVRAIACKPLAGALRLVALGEKVFPSQVVGTFTSGPIAGTVDPRPALTGQLSTRELEILRCLVHGESNKVISRRLCISDATVKVHIKAILRKLRVVNRTQAAIWAVNRGLGEERLPVRLEAGAARMQMPTHQAA